MGAIAEALRTELTEAEFSEGYAESFLNASIATQLKVLRQQRGLTQAKLAEKLETAQAVVSRNENVNYANWSIATLKKAARILEVRLKVTFEEYGTLPEEVEGFSATALQRAPRSKDPNLRHKPLNLAAGAQQAADNNLVDIGEYRQRYQSGGQGENQVLDPLKQDLEKKGVCSAVLTQSEGQKSLNGTL